MIRGLLLVLIALVTGCTGGHAEFTGQVTYRGKPVYRGSITVVGSDNVPHIAAIGEDGTFRFDNVPAGVVKIGVLCPEPIADDIEQASELGKKLAGTGIAPAPLGLSQRGFKIPESYGDPDTSNLTVEIVKPSTMKQIELQD